MNVAVFETCNLSAKERQYVVDLPDSAAEFYLGEQCIIGDHNLQGFQNIRNVLPNKTVAFIQKGDYTEFYLCTEIGNGHNTGNTITDSGNVSVEERNDANIIMYTCDGCWQNVIYTVWKKTSVKEGLFRKEEKELCRKLEI